MGCSGMDGGAEGAYRMTAKLLDCATGGVVEPAVYFGRGAGLGRRGEHELNI